MKKILLTLVTLSMIVPISIQGKTNEEYLNVLSTSESEILDLSTPEKTIEYMNSYSSYGDIITNGFTYINGKKIYLQVTYENRNEALNRFKKVYNEKLNQIKFSNKYDELSVYNYNEYYNYIRNYGEDIFKDNYNDVLFFFDTFENDDFNTKILSYSKQKKTLSYDCLYEIESISPDYNDRLIVKQSRDLLSKLPNKKNAISYAKKYAVKPNPAYKNFSSSGGDCTNFASQIARAGGIADRVYWKPYIYGWINAHGFGISFGKKNQTKKWNTLASKLSPGSFIGADFNGDGTLDHIAFITGNGSTSTEKYIAQHTSNYHKLSTNTSWPNNSSSRILWQIGNP